MALTPTNTGFKMALLMRGKIKVCLGTLKIIARRTYGVADTTLFTPWNETNPYPYIYFFFRLFFPLLFCGYVLFFFQRVTSLFLLFSFSLKWLQVKEKRKIDSVSLQFEIPYPRFPHLVVVHRCGYPFCVHERICRGEAKRGEARRGGFGWVAQGWWEELGGVRTNWMGRVKAGQRS